jgi:hypothetical protein
VKGRNGEIKYFPPTRDDNTWSSRAQWRIQIAEMDIDGLEVGSTQILAPFYPYFRKTHPLTSKRETCAAFLYEREEETST